MSWEKGSKTLKVKFVGIALSKWDYASCWLVAKNFLWGKSH